MSSSPLRWLRIVIAVVVVACVSAVFADAWGFVPGGLGHQLASAQFVPSLVALVSGASISMACVVVLLATLAAGRVYCAVVCPLGILQDVVIRLRRRLSGRGPVTRHAPALTWVRRSFFWATVIAVVAGWGGVALTLLDPYSIFGRIASGFIRPLAALAGNTLVGVAERLGWPGPFRVEPVWASTGILVAIGLPLALVAGLAVWRGRLYCNTVCPVGTVLGWVAQRAAFRLEIEPGTCQKCGDCLRVCKAQCIDLRRGAIDSSRCVNCYNCLAVCQHQGIGYRFKWAGSISPAAGGNRRSHDPQRRSFIARSLVGLAAGTAIGSVLRAAGTENPAANGDARLRSPVICPPGASGIERFLDRCTGCHLCVSACPTHVLQPSLFEYGLFGLLRPRMDYTVAFCNFDCRRCGEACPNGAIQLLELADKQAAKIGEAVFDREKCVVVTNGTDCAACSEHCPTKAVFTKPHGENLRLPEVNASLCIGCGACEFACPVKPAKAIVVTGILQHVRAEKLVEPKATAPAGAGDFPF